MTAIKEKLFPILVSISCFLELGEAKLQTKRLGCSLHWFDFTLLKIKDRGRSRHSCNSPVHRSITRASSQHIANEKSVHPGFSSSRKMSINWYLFIRSKSPRRFHALYWEVHHVDRNRQRPSCTRPRGQHSWQSSLVSPEGMVWLCSWCCLIE